MERNKKLQKFNNDLIMDAKLKASRIDFILTHLLDFNNAPQFDEKINDVSIMNEKEHKLLQDSLINTINICNDIFSRVLNEMEKKGAGNGTITNTTTD